MTCKQLVVQHPKTVAVWLQLLLLPHPSTMLQVSVMVTLGQAPLVTMLVVVTRTLVSVPLEVGMPTAQQVVTTGWSKFQVVPHCTDLLVGHCTCKQFCPKPLFVTRM